METTGYDLINFIFPPRRSRVGPEHMKNRGEIDYRDKGERRE